MERGGIALGEHRGIIQHINGRRMLPRMHTRGLERRQSRMATRRNTGTRQASLPLQAWISTPATSAIATQLVAAGEPSDLGGHGANNWLDRFVGGFAARRMAAASTGSGTLGGCPLRPVHGHRHEPRSTAGLEGRLGGGGSGAACLCL
jgi:hypothetical protein